VKCFFFNIEINFVLQGIHVCGNSPVSVIRTPRIALTFKGRHDVLKSFCQYDIHVIADQRANVWNRKSTVESKRNMLWLGFDLTWLGISTSYVF
jgi:hypothetical protein